MVWNKGFTLIELLVVIAIILILIAIALPNFLEARDRALVTAARGNLRAVETAMTQHLMDWGSIPADFNDSLQNIISFRARSIANPICSIRPDTLFQGDGGLDFLNDPPVTGASLRRTFYLPGMHCPLTTPIPYLQPKRVVDPFSDGSIPIGFDSREQQRGGKADRIIYGAFWSAGPDRMAGDWIRFSPHNLDIDGDGCHEALPYTPTNGTRSRGELWGVVGDPQYIYAKNQLPCGSAFREYRMMRW